MADTPPQLQTMTILWGAMASTPMLLGVVLMVTPRPEGADLAPVMPLVLGVVALGVAYLSVIFEGGGLKRAAKKATVKIEARVAQTETGFRDAAPRKQVIVTSRSKAIGSMLRWYMTPFILGLALGEAVVIQGFVLAFLGYGVAIWAPFFAVGWLLVLSRMPRVSRLSAAIERGQGARFAE